MLAFSIHVSLSGERVVYILRMPLCIIDSHKLCSIITDLPISAKFELGIFRTRIVTWRIKLMHCHKKYRYVAQAIKKAFSPCSNVSTSPSSGFSCMSIFILIRLNSVVIHPCCASLHVWTFWYLEATKTNKHQIYPSDCDAFSWHMKHTL